MTFLHESLEKVEANKDDGVHYTICNATRI